MPITSFRTRFERAIFAGIVVVLLGAVVAKVAGWGQNIGAFPDPIADKPIVDKLRAIDAAWQHWSSLKISHYRIRIDFPEHDDCKYDAEVLEEKVSQTYENNCKLRDMTISSLFEGLEYDTQNIEWINGPGCNFLAVYPTFNRAWNFPQKIEYRQEWAAEENVGRLAGTRAPRQVCYLLLSVRPTLWVRSLIPLEGSKVLIF